MNQQKVKSLTFKRKSCSIILALSCWIGGLGYMDIQLTIKPILQLIIKKFHVVIGQNNIFEKQVTGHLVLFTSMIPINLYSPNFMYYFRFTRIEFSCPMYLFRSLSPTLSCSLPPYIL